MKLRDTLNNGMKIKPLCKIIIIFVSIINNFKNIIFMEKFLSVPVTDEQNQIVSANGVALVEQASTTTVVITYHSGLAATITHATAGAGVETERDYIQDQILKVNEKDYPDNKIQLGALPFAVSGIAVAKIAQPTS